MKVLHVDNQVLTTVKPAGLPTVPDDSGDPSLLDLARDWVGREYAKPGNVFLGVVHRLDRPVSGLVVFGRTSKGASRLSEAFRTTRIRKTYWAAVEGGPTGDQGEVRQWLMKDRERNRVHVVGGPVSEAKEAVTTWRVLARAGGRSLLELRPQTGRSHQLRVALSSLGAPILGDLKYGASGALADRSIALHARGLELAHPTREERWRFEAPLPEAFPWHRGFGPIPAPDGLAERLGEPTE